MGFLVEQNPELFAWRLWSCVINDLFGCASVPRHCLLDVKPMITNYPRRLAIGISWASHNSTVEAENSWTLVRLFQPWDDDDVASSGWAKVMLSSDSSEISSPRFYLPLRGRCHCLAAPGTSSVSNDIVSVVSLHAPSLLFNESNYCAIYASFVLDSPSFFRNSAKCAEIRILFFIIFIFYSYPNGRSSR